MPSPPLPKPWSPPAATLDHDEFLSAMRADRERAEAAAARPRPPIAKPAPIAHPAQPGPKPGPRAARERWQALDEATRELIPLKLVQRRMYARMTFDEAIAKGPSIFADPQPTPKHRSGPALDANGYPKGHGKYDPTLPPAGWRVSKTAKAKAEARRARRKEAARRLAAALAVTSGCVRPAAAHHKGHKRRPACTGPLAVFTKTRAEREAAAWRIKARHCAELAQFHADGDPVAAKIYFDVIARAEGMAAAWQRDADAMPGRPPA
jgi:hypothetical protein